MELWRYPCLLRQPVVWQSDRVPLQDEIVGGTGMFEGITGTVSGTLSIAGGVAIARLSGTVTYGC